MSIRRNRSEILTISVLPNFTIELQNRLVRLIKEVFTENPALQYLQTNVSFDKILNSGYIESIAKLVFVSSHEEPAGLISFKYYEPPYSAIHFSEFSPKDLSNRTLYTNEQMDSFWSNIYNQYWDEKNSSRRFGINVLKRMAIKGYMLNFNDIRKSIDEALIGRRNEKLLEYINEFYYFSKRNCLLGLSTTNGMLLIRLQAVKKILESNDDATVKKCLLNLFTCFDKTLSKFADLNIREFSTETAEIVEQSVLNRVINGDAYSRRFYRYLNDDHDQEQFKRHIQEYIKTTIKEAFDGQIFGINDQYSYANVISNILKSRQYNEKQIYKDGFSKGIKIGLKLEMIGWEPCDPNFADDSESTSMWWKKDVDIHPSSFIWGDKRYLIPENERNHFWVKTLYINQHGKMRADANHPNVSGSSVCMGDLIVNFSDESNPLAECLVRVEELLDMINYDSSYRSEYRDDLMKVSTVQESLYSSFNDNVKDKVRNSSTIRELGTNFDDTDDDEEEDLGDGIEDSVTNITRVNDNNGDLIAEIHMSSISNTQETNQRSQNLSTDEQSDEDMISDFESSDPSDNSYELNESIVVNDVNLVNSQGEQRPLVFTMPSNQRPSNESFSLGDTNLVGGQ